MEFDEALARTNGRPRYKKAFIWGLGVACPRCGHATPRPQLNAFYPTVLVRGLREQVRWGRSVVKYGVRVSQIKPSNSFRLHPTSMISKHSTTPIP